MLFAEAQPVLIKVDLRGVHRDSSPWRQIDISEYPIA